MGREDQILLMILEKITHFRIFIHYFLIEVIFSFFYNVIALFLKMICWCESSLVTLEINCIITICGRKRSIAIHLIARRPETSMKLKHLILHSVCRLWLIISVNASAINFVLASSSRMDYVMIEFAFLPLL